MSVVINVIDGNEVTIQRQDPVEVTLQNVLANQVTIQQESPIAVTLQNTTPNQVNIQQQNNVGVTLQNIVPNSVVVSNGLSGGGSWGSITGEITDQTDLVTYVAAERQSYAIESPDGTSFIIVAGNDGTLAAIPPTSTAPSITTLPTISGTLEVGETLTATAGTTSGVPTPTRVLQWQRSDDGTTGWADISGATGTTYLLAFNDEDKYIRVAQTEENILGTATANSASTTQIQPVAALLLDGYPNAEAAYSLRKLSLNYSGDAIVVRRASDNTTQSIGFSGNQLDTASLESFCAGTDGFVTTWFDQSGNGNDAAQTNAGNQKQIVTNGNVNVSNNKPNTTNDDTAYDILGITTGNVNACFFCVAKATTSSMLFSNSAIPPYYGFAQDNDLAAGWSGPSAPSQFVNGNSIGLSRNDLYDSISSKGLISLFADTSTMNRKYRLGYNTTSIPFFYEFQELIIYHNDQSGNRIGIETNINAFYNIY